MQFACNGCGKCCQGHHVPLTLDEADRWVGDGGEVVILLEAVLNDGLGLPEEQRQHVLRRSFAVQCGEVRAHLAVTVAAFNDGRCRNLDEQMRCTIYDQRPLVCRIYPMEINPHLALRTAQKDCPPETWQSGPPLIVGHGQPADPYLALLIERSRQADRDEVIAKVAICEALGIHTTALKGDGFTLFKPDAGAFRRALVTLREQPLAPSADWRLHVSSEALARQLAETGARIEALLAGNATFIPLRAT
ncbi:MAG: hypothetical protein GAK43_00534 [Stenotrophomonas maltophilia]|nr:MAG: hypothetical protein GAK43_00534 [Stenotrophomonas maltophilia]